MNPNPPPPPPPPQFTPGAQAPMSGTAVAAFVSSLLICIPCLSQIVAVVLGIIALTTLNGRRGKGLAIAALVISIGLAVPVTGVLAAIAIPNFIKFQSRAKQAECKTNLKAIYLAEKSHYAEADEYSDDPAALHLDVNAAWYSYYLEGGEPFAVATKGKGAQLPEDLEVSVDDDTFTAACAGNIDSDATADVWMVSSEDTQLLGQIVPAGEPYNVVNDVTD